MPGYKQACECVLTPLNQTFRNGQVFCYVHVTTVGGGREPPPPGLKDHSKKNCHTTSCSLRVFTAVGEFYQLKELNKYLPVSFLSVRFDQNRRSYQPCSQEAHKRTGTSSIRKTVLSAFPQQGAWPGHEGEQVSPPCKLPHMDRGELVLTRRILSLSWKSTMVT